MTDYIATATECSNDVRAALLFALWHHQGGSSVVGQSIRALFGMAPRENLTACQLDAALRVHSALGQAETAQDREDALRYRWLRDVGDATWRPFGIRDGYSAEKANAAIDAAIDAARQAPKEQGHAD